MKYHKLVENAGKPKGFWGNLMINLMNKGHEKVTEWGLSHIRINCDDNILDVGCGGGKTVDRLCKKVTLGKVYGVDYSKLCVDKSQKLNKRNILCGKAKIIHASVSDLPFNSEKFDLVTAVETYYFWPDKLNDLKEIYRTLKIGGKICLIFEMLKSEDEPLKWEKVEDALSIKAVSEKDISGMLEKAGYKNIETFVEKDFGWLCATAEK